MQFNIKNTKGKARLGEIVFPRGTIKTPALCQLAPMAQ
jgi:queuine/archaeosine tRNA-ribosyltransferase